MVLMAYKQARKIAKLMIIKITQSRFATFLDSWMHIPQDYSFIVLGSHGVGLHSLLFYLSLCKSKEGKHIYPMPFHILSSNFDLYGNLKVLRFYNKMYPIINKQKEWGITFDGLHHQQTWINHNIKKQAPLIFLIRDPIHRIVSILNFELFYSIHTGNNMSKNEVFSKIIQKGFICTNYSFSLPKIKTNQICYVDCSDLMGEKTYSTMQKLAIFLDAQVSFSESFKHSINSPIQRYFTDPIIYNNQELYLSSFPHFFRITSYPHYFSPNYCDDLGYTHQQPYSSSLFPDQELYLFSKDQIEITKDLREKIEEYLSKFKNILEEYNKQKITPSDFIDLVIKHGNLRKIQKALEEEVSVVPKEMVQKWEDYLHFMQIKG